MLRWWEKGVRVQARLCHKGPNLRKNKIVVVHVRKDSMYMLYYETGSHYVVLAGLELTR